MEIALLTDDAMADFLDAVQAERGDEAWQRLAGLMRDVRDGTRAFWVARCDGAYAGMVSVRWQSDYAGFRTTPVAAEIVDLYVWHALRRQGLAGRLMDRAEHDLRDRGYERAGLSVGILAEDMPAWPFYHARGYRFDGTGAWWRGQRVTPSSVVAMTTDAVLLMMSKTL